MNNIHQKETESTVVGLCLPILFMVLVLQLLDNLLLLAQREKNLFSGCHGNITGIVH